METKFSVFSLPLEFIRELTWLNYVTPHFLEGIYHQWCKKFGVNVYEELEEVVENMLSKHNSDKVNLIGHSMGCLKALSYTLDNPGKVDTCVTIAGPFGGTNFSIAGLASIAFWVYTPAVLQMMPSSDYTKKLKSKIREKIPELENTDVKLINIWSEIDEFLPKENTSLEKILERESPIVEEHHLYQCHGTIVSCDYTTKILHDIIDNSEHPTILLHGLFMNKNFYNNFINGLKDESKEKVYAFSYDYTRPLEA